MIEQSLALMEYNGEVGLIEKSMTRQGNREIESSSTEDIHSKILRLHKIRLPG